MTGINDVFAAVLKRRDDETERAVSEMGQMEDAIEEAVEIAEELDGVIVFLSFVVNRIGGVMDKLGALMEENKVLSLAEAKSLAEEFSATASIFDGFIEAAKEFSADRGYAYDDDGDEDEDDEDGDNDEEIAAAA